MERKDYLMEHITVREARQAIADKKTVIVPLGICEQHGYHLPLSMDSYNAYELSKAAAAESNALVAPPLHYSYSGGVLPGTINVSPQVVGLMVREICQSLFSQGFVSVVVTLGHGGTELNNAIKDQVNLMLRDNPAYKDNILALVPLWELSSTWMEYVQAKDFHAATIETSVMLHWAPELVRDEYIVDEEPCLSELREHQDNYFVETKKLDHKYIIPHINQRPDMQVGVMGDPNGASAELGKKVHDEVTAGLVDFINQVQKAQ